MMWKYLVCVIVSCIQLQANLIHADTLIHIPRHHDQLNVDTGISSDGSTWFVWESNSHLSRDEKSEIVTISYDRNQQPSSPEIVVNETTATPQYNPSIAVQPNGDATIVWDQYGDENTPYGVYMRQFSSSGAARIKETVVNTNSDAWRTPRTPQIALSYRNSSAVTFRHERGFTTGISAQNLTQNNGLDGTAYWIDSGGRSRLESSNPLFFFNDGSYCVAYEGESARSMLYGRIISRGHKPSARFDINQNATEGPYKSSISGNGDNFVIAWQSKRQGGTYETDIYVRIFNKTGRPLGGEVLVNNITDGNHEAPDVAMLPDGRFIVVWFGKAQGATWPDIYARKFDSQGNALGDQYQVNQYTRFKQENPSIAMNASGKHVIAWEDHSQEKALGDDKNDVGIFARWFKSFDDITGFDGTSPGPSASTGTQTTDQKYTDPNSVDEKGPSNWSPVAITCVDPEIKRISKVTATKGLYTDKIVVEWQPAENATGYAIYRSGSWHLETGMTIAGKDAFRTLHPLHTDLLIGQTPPDIFEFTDHKANIENKTAYTTEYYYWVKPIVGNCVSLPGANDSGYTKPLPATFLSATRGKYSSKIEIQFESSRGGSIFELYRSENEEMNGAEIIFRRTAIWNKKSGYKHTLTDKHPKKGKHYFYAIRISGIGGSKSGLSKSVEGWAD